MRFYHRSILLDPLSYIQILFCREFRKFSFRIIDTWFVWAWDRSSPDNPRCSSLSGPLGRLQSTGSSDEVTFKMKVMKWYNNHTVSIMCLMCLEFTWKDIFCMSGDIEVAVYISDPATNLWRRQASCSIGTHREHGEFPGCAALALWRGSEGAPLWAGQRFDQGRVDQGHLPLCGDVVTWEISTSGRWGRFL